MTPISNRSINWFEHSCQNIHSRIHELQSPRFREVQSLIVARLSALLLERLPPELGHSILELLPEHVVDDHFPMLQASANCPAEASIGYSQFLDKAKVTLGCTEVDSDQETLPSRLVDTFLWAIAQEFPPDLKTQMLRYLPSDLAYRMNLSSAISDESKVA